MEKTFKTIKVNMELDVEISMHPSGRIRVHSCVNPNLNQIEDQLIAVYKTESLPDVSSLKYLTRFDDWVILQK